MPSHLETERDLTNLFKIRSSLACVPCRTRHVKCGAEKPNCVRCEADGRSCHYVQSRRGLKYKTSPANSPEDAIPQNLSIPNSMHQTASPVARNLPLQDPAAEILSQRGIDALWPQVVVCQNSQRSKQSAPFSPQNRTSTFLDQYYTFFHHAHPYVLPQRSFKKYLETNRLLVADLLIVLEFIGSTYSPEGQSAELKEHAISTMLRHDLPLTAFTVQALLLLAISVHCCNGFELARSLLDKASSIALEIGMHFKYFATTHGNGDSVLEESWRRTWWGLYVVDGIFQVIQRSACFELWHVQADVDLPCEESDYASEVIPEPHSIFEYNDREFAESEVSYSSFTYLIDIVRIMGSVMAVVGECGNFSDSLVDDTDGQLVNWELHLPEDKKDVLRGDGETDEPLFHAHMIFNVTKVFLHRQRSRLIHSPIENLAKCAPTPPPSEVPISQRRAYWLSTKKTMDGAERALNLFTAPTACVKHTPLMVCAVALSILAALSACSYVLEGKEYETARTRIRLGIGTLKEYGKTWPVGGQTLSEVKTIAREVFAMKAQRTGLLDGTSPEFPPLELTPSLDIQSYFNEFGALDCFRLFEIPGQIKELTQV